MGAPGASHLGTWEGTMPVLNTGTENSPSESRMLGPLIPRRIRIRDKEHPANPANSASTAILYS